MAIAFLSSASRTVTSSSPSTVTVRDAPAGALLVLGTTIGSSVANATVSTVTDADGNTWLFARRGDVSTTILPAVKAEIWYAANIVGASTSLSVTVTWPGHGSSLVTQNHIGAFSGAAITPLDQTTAKRMNSSAVDAGNLTPPMNGALFYEVMGILTGVVWTPRGAYTEMSTLSRSYAAYLIQAVAAESSGPAGLNGNNDIVAVMATFLPPAGAAYPWSPMLMTLGVQ